MLKDYLQGNTLLVSAYADNAVLSYIDGVWSKAAIPEARGIAIGDNLAVVGQNQIVYFRPDGSRAVTIHTDEIHGHEAVHDSSNTLWVAASQTSSLTTFDTFGTAVEKWRIPGTDSSADNRSHLNGIALQDGSPKYVTALGISNQPNGWREKATQGRGALIDVDTNEIILHDLFMPHSPRWHDSKVWFLNSGHGELCTWTPGQTTRTVITKFQGFSRGLLLTDTHAFIGISQGRITAFPNLTIDPLAQPGIAVIDLATAEQVYFESLDVQEIFDIQIGTAPLVV